MQKSFITVLLAVSSGMVMANPVDLKRNGVGDRSLIIDNKLPFEVDFNIDQLKIRVKDSNSLVVVVVGPQGVVYNKVINAATPKSVYVDLERYRDGDYEIYIQDAKGNNVSGEFYKEKSEYSLNY